MEVTTENKNLLQNIVQENDSNDLERPITNEEISSSIKSIHSNRSPGPHGICIEMFKNIQNEILPFLNSLFNEIYDRGELPPPSPSPIGAKISFVPYTRVDH